jgi:hypothetical protein
MSLISLDFSVASGGKNGPESVRACRHPRTAGRIVYRDPTLPFGNDDNFIININTSIDRPLAAAGLLSTPADLAVFAQTFMNGGVYKGVRILSPVTVSEMTPNQVPGVPAQGWGGRMVEGSWGLGCIVQGEEKWPCGATPQLELHQPVTRREASALTSRGRWAGTAMARQSRRLRLPRLMRMPHAAPRGDPTLSDVHRCDFRL